MNFQDCDRPLHLTAWGTVDSIAPLAASLRAAFAHWAGERGHHAVLLPLGPVTSEARFVIAFPDRDALEQGAHLADKFVMALSAVFHEALREGRIPDTPMADALAAMAEIATRGGGYAVYLSVRGGLRAEFTGLERLAGRA